MRPAATLVIAALCCSLAAAPYDAQAASYPDHPIKLIVPTAPGTIPDVTARLVGERLAPLLGQPIVVENRPGAIGTIGLNAVAKAPPDGYTLGVLTTTYLAAVNLIPHMPYDPEKDLSPIGVVAWNYQILCVRSGLPVRSIPELIALAKSKPGALKYSTPGNATPSHLGMKLFEQQTGTELVHVPYKGGSAAVTALLRGDVDIFLTGVLTIEPHVKSGAVRKIATIAPQRLAASPELPTLVELGFPDLEYTDWQSIVAPAGTPPEVIERLRAALADIVARPEVKELLQQWSMEPAGLGPVELKRLIHSEIQRSGRLIHEAHITTD